MGILNRLSAAIVKRALGGEIGLSTDDIYKHHAAGQRGPTQCVRGRRRLVPRPYPSTSRHRRTPMPDGGCWHSTWRVLPKCIFDEDGRKVKASENAVAAALDRPGGSAIGSINRQQFWEYIVNQMLQHGRALSLISHVRHRKRGCARRTWRSGKWTLTPTRPALR